MWSKTVLIFFIMKLKLSEVELLQWAIKGNPEVHAHPCGYDNITLTFESGLPPEEENQYYINITPDIPLPAKSRVELKFDSQASVTLGDPSVARISARDDYFDLHFFKGADHVGFKVKGPVNVSTVPYLISIKVNGEESCENHTTGFLDPYILGYRENAEILLTVPDDSCGHRKVKHIELITNGLKTKPGDWPWHVAIYRLEKTDIRYICGGTLLSKFFVLTAAHCVTIRGSAVLPEILSVVLAKYKLIGGDIEQVEREVHQIKVHEEFSVKHLNNDIALLKLKFEVSYNDYIQPACLWYPGVEKELPKEQVIGTVVGWGFDHTDKLSPQLHQAIIPKVSDAECIKSYPEFYGSVLNDQKFCAGLRNGTSACNGDSGGGFVVFVPSKLSSSTSSDVQGAWYVRGVISMSVARPDVALCDPNHYVVFTDVGKYRDWIKKYVF